MLARTRIRAAARAALTAALPSVRVGPVRTYSRSREGLPAIEVTTPNEDATLVNGRAGFLREVTLGVLIWSVAGDVEDVLDALAAIVEPTLMRDGGILAECEALLLSRTTFDPGDGAEGRPARMTLTFTARGVK